MQSFARHRAWLAAPEVRVEVDHERDLVLVTCYPALPDVDVEESDTLSAGFHGEPGDQLLTTLAFSGLPRWDRADDPEAETARHLAGPTVSGAVTATVRAGPGDERVITLTRGEGEELFARWKAFLAQH